VAKNDKTRFFYVLYSDETCVFDLSESAQGPIYIIILENFQNGEELASGLTNIADIFKIIYCTSP